MVEAVNGLDALNKLDGGEADVIITDLGMPLMDGLEFIKRLSTVPAYRYLPIIGEGLRKIKFDWHCWRHKYFVDGSPDDE